jgi:hypothetical protein
MPNPSLSIHSKDKQYLQNDICHRDMKCASKFHDSLLALIFQFRLRILSCSVESNVDILDTFLNFVVAELICVGKASKGKRNTMRIGVVGLTRKIKNEWKLTISAAKRCTFLSVCAILMANAISSLCSLNLVHDHHCPSLMWHRPDCWTSPHLALAWHWESGWHECKSRRLC